MVRPTEYNFFCKDVLVRSKEGEMATDMASGSGVLWGGGGVKELRGLTLACSVQGAAAAWALPTIILRVMPPRGTRPSESTERR